MGKNADMNDVVLKVEHLTKHYPIKKGVFGKSDACVHALEDASFEVHRGETFAIVGESGCGKSTTGKCILRLTEPTSGEVFLDGEDFTKLKGEGPHARPPEDEAHLPGPVQLPQPAHDCGRHHCRAH